MNKSVSALVSLFLSFILFSQSVQTAFAQEDVETQMTQLRKCFNEQFAELERMYKQVYAEPPDTTQNKKADRTKIKKQSTEDQTKIDPQTRVDILKTIFDILNDEKNFTSDIIEYSGFLIGASSIVAGLYKHVRNAKTARLKKIAEDAEKKVFEKRVRIGTVALWAAGTIFIIASYLYKTNEDDKEEAVAVETKDIHEVSNVNDFFLLLQEDNEGMRTIRRKLSRACRNHTTLTDEQKLEIIRQVHDSLVSVGD